MQSGKGKVLGMMDTCVVKMKYLPFADGNHSSPRKPVHTREQQAESGTQRLADSQDVQLKRNCAHMASVTQGQADIVGEKTYSSSLTPFLSVVTEHQNSDTPTSTIMFT